MSLKDSFGNFLTSYSQALDKIGDNWEQYLKEQEEKLNQGITAREQKELAQKIALQEQNYARMQQIDEARQVEAVRQQMRNNEYDIRERELKLERERDELERNKTAQRLQFDRERQQMDLDRQRFDYEQERANKAQDNDFSLQMADKQLRKQEQQQNHEHNMGRLTIDYEQARAKSAEQEAIEDIRRKILSFNSSDSDSDPYGEY